MNEPNEITLEEWGMMLYDAFEPIRVFVRDHPETKEMMTDLTKEILMAQFAPNFYGPSPHDK